MKKRWILLLVSLLLSVSGAAFDGVCTFVEHGTIKAGESRGCWIFVADDGEAYQPIGGPDSIYSDGLSGLLIGTLTEDHSGYCKAGEQILVCRFEVDSEIIMVGTVGYVKSPKGGCWTLFADRKTYEPISISRSFYRLGIRVRVRCVVRPDQSTSCALGPVLEILDYEVLTPDDGGFGTPSSPDCQSAYAHCLRVCGDNACYVSCETLLEACNGSP